MTKQFSNYSDLLTFTRASKGHALRPVSYGTELVTNGTFDTDVSGWSDDSSAGGSIAWNSSGYLNLAATTGTSRASQSIDTTAGNIYFISLEVIALNGSTGPVLYFDGVQQGSALTVGTTTFVYVATGSSVAVSIRNFTTGTTVYIDNISVKEVLFDQPDGTLTLFEHPVNVPRVEWDSAGNRLGLLVEEARTNLVTYSEPTVSDLGLSGDVSDGDFEGSLGLTKGILFGDNSTLRYAYFTPVTSSGVDYTVSVFIKMDDGSEPNVGTTTTDGDLGLVSGGALIGNTPTITAMGSNVYRVSSTRTSTNTNTNYGVIKYTTQSSKGFTVTGFQVEQASFPTSYIKTTGATATRSADVASIPVADFGWNNKAGSTVVEFQPSNLQSQQSWMLGTNDTSSRWAYSNPSQDAISIFDGTTVRQTGSAIEGQINKVATASTLERFIVLANGESKPDAATNGNLIRLTTEFRFGSSNFNTNQLNGHIKSIQYYPRRLTNAQLQALTEPRSTPTLSLTFDGLESSYTENYIHG